MNKKDALLQYANIIGQIELLKLQLKPLERIILGRDEVQPGSYDTNSEGEIRQREWKGRDFSITPNVLKYLIEYKRPASVKEIKKHIGTNDNRIRQSLERLITAGKVKKSQGEIYKEYQAIE